MGITCWFPALGGVLPCAPLRTPIPRGSPLVLARKWHDRSHPACLLGADKRQHPGHTVVRLVNDHIEGGSPQIERQKDEADMKKARFAFTFPVERNEKQ